MNGEELKASNTPVEINQTLEVQLIRDDRPLLGGDFHTGKTGYWRFSSVEGDETITMNVSGMVTPIVGTCSVPPQIVQLPREKLDSLSLVGSTSGTRNFQIQINNCPSGYNRVGYMFERLGGENEKGVGVLPLAAGSTASGVKIQIANEKGDPANMGTSIALDAYDKTSGGSYRVSMQARYIRTDAVVKPGTVNGALRVHLDYR
ncbi:hypothetical protein PflCFBP13517_25740 [Pseudomonas fluorescens]|nr:hypothetical protein PflCFBP13517_25740 [Pseudomonas fluorescens]